MQVILTFFIQNARKMGIGLLELDMIVFSHGHLDHTGGLPGFSQYLTGAIMEGVPHKVPEILLPPLLLLSSSKITHTETSVPW